MSWRPTCGPETARARASMLDRARGFFRERRILEVSTPALVAATATDPNIESIRALPGGRARYLHTSPEHCMKRLLAGGYPDIFQICRVFRDGETGRHHLPEFTLIEWYRKGYSLEQMIAESVELAGVLLAGKQLAQHRQLSYRDAFQEALGIDPLATGPGALADVLGADAGLRAQLGQDLDAWLDLAVAQRIAPEFPADRLTALCYYPASQASLARLSPQDERLAERFELYLGPLELANGFVELGDASEQEARFTRDLEKRAADGRAAVPLDRRLIEALVSGLPDCAGVALGLDRLLMIDQGLDNIADCVSFFPGADDEH